MMDDILAGVENTSSFMDEINTYNGTFEEMLVTLRQTLDKLRSAHLRCELISVSLVIVK